MVPCCYWRAVTMYIYRVADGTVLRAFAGVQSDMTGAVWSTDGTRVACSYKSGPCLVKTFDLHGDSVVQVAHGSTYPCCVAWAPDNHSLAVGCEAGDMLVVNLLDNNEWRQLKGVSWTMQHLHFSADGGRLIAASNKNLCVWRMDDDSLLWSVSVSGIRSISVSPDGLFVAVGCKAQTSSKFVLFDCATGEKVIENNLPADLQALSFAPGDYRLAVCLAQEEKVRLYTLSELSVGGLPENAALRHTSTLAFAQDEEDEEELLAVSRDTSLLIIHTCSQARALQ